MLTINNLSGGFVAQKVFSQVLHDINLDIRPQETVALVGESGSGKSVLAHSILQLHDKEQYRASGEILFHDQNLLTCSDPEIRAIRGNRISMIFQEPMTSLNPVYPIGRQLMEPLLIHRGMSRQEAHKEALKLLDQTGIQNGLRKMADYPHQLSGGQRQRVMISMALACRPELLIADEPTTALDVTIQAQILLLHQELQEQYQMAILLISHDLNMVKKVAQRVSIMKAGRIVEHGDTGKIFSEPEHEYTRHLLASVPHGEQVARLDRPPLLTLKNMRCAFPIKKGFFKRQVGEIVAVDNVSLTVREGTTYGIVGESGSGKSTLGYALLRLLAAEGSIFFEGKDIKQLQPRQMRALRARMQIVFQDPFSSLSPRLTVGPILQEGLAVHNIGDSGLERDALAAKALEEVGLEARMAERYPHEFSGGQRQRIAIARAIVLKPKFIVMDEPTSALDMTIQAQIICLLKDLQQRYNIAYLFISHDLRIIRALADEIAVMKDGRIIEQGTTQDIFRNPTHEYTQKLFAAAGFVSSLPESP
ncbi:MAG: ABC transporter ATP-binding protein [Deltaproteobacteria bacterium]|jgi:microcin C transport system ATP-binding protein|nr:ABC transporter ATP-binding protein [Deltaproteobacteria bacterium]